MVSFYTELCPYWSQLNELYGIVCTIQIITISCGIEHSTTTYCGSEIVENIVGFVNLRIFDALPTIPVGFVCIKCYKIVTKLLQKCVFLMSYSTQSPLTHFYQLNKIDKLSTIIPSYPQSYPHYCGLFLSSSVL